MKNGGGLTAYDLSQTAVKLTSGGTAAFKKQLDSFLVGLRLPDQAAFERQWAKLVTGDGRFRIGKYVMLGHG